MAARRQILAFLLVSSISASLACGGSSPSAIQQSQPPVSIALNPAPTTTTIMVGNTSGIQFTPVVSNDPNNYGVDWALTCSLVGACGTLSIPTLHTASGTTVTYTPPTLLYTGSLTVNVTVFATADHTQNVTTAITVSSYTSVLNGTYVLQVQGEDLVSSVPYQGTGVLVLDGNGNVTSGQQTLNTVSFYSSTYTIGAASTYFIGPDGRGNMTLNLQPANPNNAAITENFTFTVISSAQARVAELEPPTSAYQTSGSGTLDLQDTTAVATMPTGAYAFVTEGIDSGNNPLGAWVPTAIGGILNVASGGSISGSGSLADQDYYNSKFTKRLLLSCGPTDLTGTVSQPSSLGMVTITLTNTSQSGGTCFGVTSPATPVTVQFTGYIVDATHIRLIESDDSVGSGGFLTAGIAVQQQNTTGFTIGSLMGPYVFGVLGYDITDFTTNGAFGGFSFTSAAVLDADGTGDITGITDTFYPGAFSNLGVGAFSGTQLTGSYALDANSIGRVLLTPAFPRPPKPKPNVLLYLTGNGTPPLILWSEEDINFPAIGTGIAYPQAANASTLTLGNPETYGFTFSENNGTENDGNGEVQSTINGSGSTSTGTLTGRVEDDTYNNDFNISGSLPYTPITDTFGPPAAADSFGRISGTLSNACAGTGCTPNTYFEYYLVDDNYGFMIETDLANSFQVGFAHFAQACDVTNATSCQAAAQNSKKRAVKRGGSRSAK